jgi:hypothetical protein
MMVLTKAGARHWMAGLMPQFYSNGEAVPFVAHPDNVRDFFAQVLP